MDQSTQFPGLDPQSFDVSTPAVAVATPAHDEGAKERWIPREPADLAKSGLTRTDVEALVLKVLLNLEVASGRRIAAQLKLPFGLLQEVLMSMKQQMTVAYKTSAAMSDYEYELTQTGLQRARRFHDRCTYFGAAPVALPDYIASIKTQSIKNQRPRLADFLGAFGDLLLSTEMISQVGQAVNSGRGLFLYGEPGNGKTSIAERVIRGLDDTIWIPRTITVSGEIIRMFDASCHEEVPLEADGPLLNASRTDQRWVRIRRPTVVVGGELTLDHLEITYNEVTGINESPLQFKSNGGALVIDDFGRQQISVTQLLNRWIVPLEKGYDYLSLPSGRQLQIPFDQLLVFSTNLQPHDLVDEAFLRRIPYKIHVDDPSERQFLELFAELSPAFGFRYDAKAARYLLEKHFRAANRPLRFCQPRDLLIQIRNYCQFHERPLELTNETIDIAVNNYFSGL